MNKVNIFENLMETLKNSIGDFANIFQNIALSIILILLTIEVIRSSIDLVSGKGMTISSKLLLYVALIGFIVSFGTIYRGVSKGVIIDTDINKNFQHLWDYVIQRHEAPLLVGKGRDLGLIYQVSGGKVDLSKVDLEYIITFLMTKISLFISLLLLVWILVTIGKHYSILMIQLAIGAVPVSLMLSPETRSTGIQFIKVIIARFLTFFLYSFAIDFSLKFIKVNQYKFYEFAPKGGGIAMFTSSVLALLLIIFLFGILSKVSESFLG
ncbi:MAG: hypothetical protein ABFR75_05580 [Acidobacteriota bacterium]